MSKSRLLLLLYAVVVVNTPGLTACMSEGEKHFQQYFSYIVGVSFIWGGNRRKPPTCRKSLTIFVT
jgi:hypothetical protein